MFLSIYAKGEGADKLSHILQKNPYKVYSRARADAWNRIKRIATSKNAKDSEVPELREAFDRFCEPPHDLTAFLDFFKDDVAKREQAELGALALRKVLTGLAEQLTVWFPVYDPEKQVANVTAFVEFPEYFLWDRDTPQAEAYVSAREYCLSSLFCREIKKAFNTAISGKYKDPDDQKAADTPLNLVIDALPVVTTLSDDKIKSLLRPLGFDPYEIKEEGQEPRRQFLVDHSYQYEWQPQKTRVLELTVQCRKTVRDVLRQLLVLIPVIDNYTHIQNLTTLPEELKNHGEGWLDRHPLKELITKRFLRFQKSLIKSFEVDEKKEPSERDLEEKINLGELRRKWFVDQVKAVGARSVVDAGCGGGHLAEEFVKANILEVEAFDCYLKAVSRTKRILLNKANVFFSSLMYYDERLVGKDAICLSEVIEHLPPFQFRKAIELIFGVYRPKYVFMSTPNREFNKHFNLPEGKFRVRDHKFEFNEVEAREFVKNIEAEFGYQGAIKPIGDNWTFDVHVPEESAVAIRDGKETVAVMVDSKKTVVTPKQEFPTFGLVFSRDSNA